MSIYCSRVTVGEDAFEPDAPGKVAAYPDNQLIRVERPDWPAGCVDTAHIPAWCVPNPDGSVPREEWDGERIAEWLRLSISVPGTHVSVLLDQEAVRALAADLRRWLKQDKVSIGSESVAKTA